MNQQTAEALHELVKVAAKIIGYEGEIIATVCNAKIPGIICVAEELPFDENNNCISCEFHVDEPLWYCPNCGEYIPNIYGEEN